MPQCIPGSHDKRNIPSGYACTCTHVPMYDWRIQLLRHGVSYLSQIFDILWKPHDCRRYAVAMESASRTTCAELQLVLVLQLFKKVPVRNITVRSTSVTKYRTVVSICPNFTVYSSWYTASHFSARTNKTRNC